MPDYQRMRYACNKTGEILGRVVDEFLLYLCDQEESLADEFAQKLVKYRHIVETMPEGFVSGLVAQYIAFQLFRRGGLAQKYTGHPMVLKRDAREIDFLKFQAVHPWRFVFCSVKEFLRDSFFAMTDVLTGEEFLLYSPAVATLEEERNVSFYFLLIFFNGKCWQAYGPVAYFQALFPFDLHYFVNELRSAPVAWTEIPAVIEEEPAPFMMLFVGAEQPLVYHRKDMIVISSSAYRVEKFDAGKYASYFFIQQKDGLYRLSLKRWHRFPHHCECYYIANEQTLYLTARTERGYEKLITVLKKMGHEFPRDPQSRATMVMIYLVREILRKEVKFNPYEEYFSEEPDLSPEEAELMERVNRFCKLLTEALNSGKPFAIEKLADQAGLDYENAREVAATLQRMIERRRV